MVYPCLSPFFLMLSDQLLRLDTFPEFLILFLYNCEFESQRGTWSLSPFKSQDYGSFVKARGR